METETPDKCIVSTYVDQAQRDRLERLAAEGDRSLSAEIRRAVTAHLERTPTGNPEEANDDADR